MSDKGRTIMYHDYEQDRWFVMTSDAGCPLRCGERVELIIGENAFSCRLELNQYGWYIIIGQIRFILSPDQTYTVAI
ncbi:hypothetical protein D3C86_2054060 [compost metagenome]